MANQCVTDRIILDASGLGKIYFLVLTLPVLAYLALGAAILGWPGLWWAFISGGWHLIILLIALYVSHELIHIVGFLSAGIPLQSIKLGFDRRTLSIELHCKEALSVRAWRRTLLLPGAILSMLIPVLAINAAEPSDYWLLLAISCSGCAFDVALFSALRDVDGNKHVIPEMLRDNDVFYLRSVEVLGQPA